MGIKQKLLDFQSKIRTSEDGTVETLSELSCWNIDLVEKFLLGCFL